MVSSTARNAIVVVISVCLVGVLLLGMYARTTTIMELQTTRLFGIDIPHFKMSNKARNYSASGEIVVNNNGTASRNSHSGNLTKDLVNYQLTSPRNRTQLLLQTYYRGGSTFLGATLGIGPEVFYYFEPLHFTQTSMYATGAEGGDRDYKLTTNGSLVPLTPAATEKRTETLQKVLSCDVTVLDQRALSDMFFVSGQSMPKFRNYTRCLKSKRTADKYKQCALVLRDTCVSNRVTAAKSIRYPMYLVDDLQKRLPNLKVIHYVRDPRGIMASRIKIHRFRGATLTKHAKMLCLKMAKNHQIFTALQKRNPKDHLFLRYEDLALNIEETVKTIYSFVALSYPDNMSGWIERNTKAKSADWQYGIRRNTAETVYRWKKTLSKADMDIITNQCQSTLHMLGYE